MARCDLHMLQESSTVCPLHRQQAAKKGAQVAEGADKAEENAR